MMFIVITCAFKVDFLWGTAMQSAILGMAAPDTGSRSPVGRLLQAASIMSGIDAEHAESITCAMLGVPDTQYIQTSGKSELNWNGSPLQLLCSLRKNRTVTRLLSDPGCHLADPMVRYQAGKTALFTSLALANAHPLYSVAGQTLLHMVPTDRAALDRYVVGNLWLAVALGMPGAALYVAPDPGAARWEKAQEWLRGITRKPDDALALIAAIQNHCVLLGVGIEGASIESLRFKIYWRMTTALPLSAFGLRLLLDSSMIKFLTQALESQEVTPDMISFSANFDLMQGTLRDVKVDISWHSHTRDEALALLDAQAEILGMASPATYKTLDLIEQFGLEISCVGLGLDTAGEYRLNTYVFQQ